MAEIPAKLVMDLRRATGMPMMKCKKALEETEGDFEKASDLLRKEGMKAAAKKADRATGEGLARFALSADGREGTLVLVVCETEPVKNTPMFQEFVDKVAAIAAEHKPADVEALRALPWPDGDGSIEDAMKALIAQIGENMGVAGYQHFTVDGGSVGGYVHNDRKTAAMVALKGDGDLQSFAKELCMHVVFAKPQVLTRDQIDAEAAAKEEAFLREQIAEDPKMAGKPEQALDGIIKGRLDKNFYGERVLTEQPWFKPDAGNKRVRDLLKEHGAEVEHFVLLRPGA